MTHHLKLYYVFADFPKNMYLIDKSEEPEELYDSTTFCDTDECDQTGDISIE